MASEKIGDARCPLCGGTSRVGLAKTQLPVLTCNACNIQLFTRSDRSDQLVRALLLAPKKDAEPAPGSNAPAPAPAPSATPQTPTPTPAAPVRTESERSGAFFF